MEMMDMPKGVVKGTKQEKIWEYKKKQVEKQTGRKASQFTETEWRRVNFLYQKAKKKHKGKLPKKYETKGSVFSDRVKEQYEILTMVKPLEHFKESGIKPFWSIQTERTHGRPGIIRISRSKLEDPNLSITTRPDYKRIAGGEDIFQGSKESLLEYLKHTYRDFKTIEFVKN
jgi:hypothetical protein